MGTVSEVSTEMLALVEAPKTFLSLGAGVQSSTLALMCAAGELPYVIDAAIFADTGAEPPAVYAWLEWITTRLPFTVWRVQKKNGNLYADGLEQRVSKAGKKYWKVQIPFFIANLDGGRGKLGRKCTSDYKVKPIVAKTRALVGQRLIRAWCRHYGVYRERIDVIVKGKKRKAWRWVKPPGTPPLARSLIGISLDEAHRAKPSREPWIENVHPLLDARITRQGCLDWMRDHGYPRPPRSACVFCPYHSDAEWSRMKREDPASFESAVRWEAAAAAAAACEITRGVPFLHSSLKPLAMIDFDANKTKDLFAEECEGLCGN